MEDITRRRLYKKRQRRTPRRIALVLGIAIMGAGAAYVFTQSGLQQGCPYTSSAQAGLSADLMPMTEPICDDAIEGVWEGSQYLHGHKYLFTLDVARKAKGSPMLVGTITSHYWDTSNHNAYSNVPPECDPSHQNNQILVSMAAEGSFHNNNFVFEGKSWELEKEACGKFSGDYLPDSFTGFLQGNSSILSINNDGMNPTTKVGLRRVSCESTQKTSTNRGCKH